MQKSGLPCISATPAAAAMPVAIIRLNCFGMILAKTALFTIGDNLKQVFTDCLPYICYSW